LKRLSAIEKKLSAPAALTPKPLTYANTARLAMPLSTQDKPVLSKAVKEVWVKVIGDPKPTQTCGGLVDLITAARSSRSGKVLAARELESREILTTADSHKTKNLIEQEEGWTKVIAEKTKGKGQSITVMVHAVRTNRIKTPNQEQAIAKRQAQNPQLKNKVKFLKLTWQ
jgi:hypothetical protein